MYNQIPVSAKLTFAGSILSGEFFVTGDFTPFDGPNNDGRITVEFDGNTIKDFTYNQELPTFMGGCPGIYTGSGSLIFPFTLSMDFTGEDCEGFHTDGKLIMTKVVR